MTPDQIASSNSESAHQKALFAWANMAAKHGTHVACYMEAYAGVAQLEAVIAAAADTHVRSYPIPELELMHHIPNGGQRTGKFGSAAAGAKMKAEGVKAGIPDIFLPVPTIGRVCAGLHMADGSVKQITVMGVLSSGLYIELKKPNEIKSTSAAQDAVLAALYKLNYTVMIADHWRTAVQGILRYLGAQHGISAPETANLIYHGQQPAPANT